MSKEYVKNYLSEMKEIKGKIDEINAIVVRLPISQWRGSLEVTMSNFEKKINGFLEAGRELTPEQKEAIARIKKGEIPAFPSVVEESVTPEEQSEEKPEKKNKKH